ncbi:hypothetical protein ABPG74_009108 [Tetrahymena malaccensis]
MTINDQLYISRGIVTDDKEYNLKIINIFDGVNNVDNTLYQNKYQERASYQQLRSDHISTFQTIFEIKGQNLFYLKISQKIEQKQKNIWEGCQLAQKIFDSTLDMNQKPQAAIDQLLLCIEQDSNNPQYYQTIGNFNQNLQKYDDSAKAYKRCLKEDQENQTCQDS